MSHPIAMLTLGLLLALGVPAQAKPGNPLSGAAAPRAAGTLVEKALDDAADPRFQSRRYLLYLPPGYKPDRRKRWPLLVYLHGNTDGKLDKTMEMLKNEGPFRWMQRTGEELDAILVAPLTEPSRLLNGVGHNELFVDAVIRRVQREHAVDPRRVSITGFSLGGQGTWTMLLAFPNRFAAAAPLAGALYPERRNRTRAPDEAWGRAFESLRGNLIRVYHSTGDEVVPFEFGKRPAELAREAGVRVEFNAIEGTHMQTPGAVYSRELFDWLTRQRRAGASAHTAAAPEQASAARRSRAAPASAAGGPDAAAYRYLGDKRFMLISDDRRAQDRPADFVWPGDGEGDGCYRAAAAPPRPGPWRLDGVDAQGRPCS